MRRAVIALGLSSFVLPGIAQQPSSEALDLGMYQRIREEGFDRSHVMDFASGLTDGIGPRLTGSPNLAKAYLWTRDQLIEMGCTKAQVEDAGEFGLGWQQRNASLRMVEPDTSVFVAQAVPWSPSTHGPLTAQATLVSITSSSDFEPYRGKLAGKIVMLGAMRDVPPIDQPLFTRWSDSDLARLTEYPVPVKPVESVTDRENRRGQLLERIVSFMATEKAAAVILPSADGRSGYVPLLGPANGGGTGILFDDMWEGFGYMSFTEAHALHTPAMIASIESYGRVYRLLKAGKSVTLEVNVDAEFTGAHEHLANVVAEIPGTDPNLKDELVMLGGHLDSWASGTGATDNGAGTAVALEVMRIFTALKIHPRRTIRIGLWSGEEQGLIGSSRYVAAHFGSSPSFEYRSSAADEMKPAQRKISVYFNVDGGSGKSRGIFTEGNLAVIPVFKQWIAPLNDLGVTTVTARHTPGTDHLSFDSVGIPAFAFIQDPLDYFGRTHHSNVDTYERLQPADMKQLAVIEAIFVYNAAMRDNMLPRKVQ